MARKIGVSKCKDEQSVVESRAWEDGKILADSEAAYIEFDEGRTVGEEERKDIAHRHVKREVSTHHHYRAEEELEQYHVYWDAITPEHITKFKGILESATTEEEIQRFLNENRIFLIQHLGGGHGRYVIPKPKLGAQLVPDFLVAEMSSIGLEWHGIELEPPSARLCTASGQPSAKLTHAIQQVVDWRAWLKNNSAYARTSKSEHGLGLVGIDMNLTATILIGRRGEKEFPLRFNEYRMQAKRDQNIEIHTYDWLVEQAENRVKMLQQSRNPKK